MAFQGVGDVEETGATPAQDCHIPPNKGLLFLFPWIKPGLFASLDQFGGQQFAPIRIVPSQKNGEGSLADGVTCAGSKGLIGEAATAGLFEGQLRGLVDEIYREGGEGTVVILQSDCVVGSEPSKKIPNAFKHARIGSTKLVDRLLGIANKG